MAILQILFSPAAAFASVRDKKWAWLLPILLMIVIGVIAMMLLFGRFSALAIIEQQVAQSGQDVPTDRLAAAAGFTQIAMYAAAAVMPPIFVLITAVVLLAIVKGLSGETKFSAMMNAAALANFGLGVVKTVLFLVMLYLAPDLRSFQLQNPIPLNVGYFFDPLESGKALVAFLSGFDLLNVYMIWLLALGASVLSNRVSTGKVLWPLVGIYVVIVLIMTGIGAIS